MMNYSPKLILIEDAENKRVVTTFRFSLQPKGENNSKTQPEAILRSLYSQLNQPDLSGGNIDREASILYHYALGIENINNNDWNIIIYCRNEFLFFDIFDKSLPKNTLCSQAGGRAELNQMKLSSFRINRTSYFN